MPGTGRLLMIECTFDTRGSSRSPGCRGRTTMQRTTDVKLVLVRDRGRNSFLIRAQGLPPKCGAAAGALFGISRPGRWPAPVCARRWPAARSCAALDGPSLAGGCRYHARCRSGCTVHLRAVDETTAALANSWSVRSSRRGPRPGLLRKRRLPSWLGQKY